MINGGNAGRNNGSSRRSGAHSSPTDTRRLVRTQGKKRATAHYKLTITSASDGRMNGNMLQGMVQTASYIRNKLEKENLLGQAFAYNPDKGTPDFRLVLVGHSLGAGTAAILALLLRHEYPHVHCYAYSPPGGLLRCTDLE